MQKNCSIHKAAEIIGKRWTLLILLELYKGKNKKKRYNELKIKLNEITPKILSSRLKELIREGLVAKYVDSSTVPIKSEYELTESGMDFINVIQRLKLWSLRWKSKNHLCKKSNCRNCKF